MGKVIDRPLTDEARNALIAALGYFREAAPKHNADEEESLFPRLRQTGGPELLPGLGKLDELEQDHRDAAPLHAEVERFGQLCLAKGELSRRDANQFRQAVNTLQAMYREHISIEDDLIFPAAARALSKADRASIAAEMAARRNVSPEPPPVDSRPSE